MIKVVGTTLVNDGKVIKSLGGAYGDGKIRVSKKDYKLYVGGLVFPLSPLNKLSFTLDGLTQMVNSKLAVTLDLMWHSIETITINTVVNLTPGQQVTFILQHGDTSYVANNLTVQTFNIPFQEGKDFIVTALNFNNGAMSTMKLDVSPGQGYDIAAVTTEENLGELQTTGGELISGGELTTVCVREGYDVQAAARYRWAGAYTADYIAVSIQDTDGTVARSQYTGLLDDMELYGTSPQLNGFTKGRELNRQAALLKGGVYLGRSADGGVTFDTIIPMTNDGTVYTVPPDKGGTYYIYLPSTGQSSNTQDAYALNVLSTVFYLSKYADGSFIPPPVINLEGGKGYIFGVNVIPQGVKTTSIPLVNTGSFWEGGIQFQSDVAVEFQMVGPMTYECLQTQDIDTRFSYVTPVVTTDTRRTVYTIEIDATALN